MAAVIAGDLLHARSLAKLRGGVLEAVKITAFAFMLFDHFAVYVAGVRDPIAEFFGAMVFPLFAFCLAVGVAPLTVEHRERLLLRIICWALVAQPFALLVRDMLPLNVLWTFAAALALDVGADRSHAGWPRVMLFALAACVGYLTEFAFPGVVIAYALIRWARSGDQGWLLAACAAQVVVTYVDQTLGAICAPLVLALYAWAKPKLPRVRGIFYPAYAGQFALCALLAALLRF